MSKSNLFENQILALIFNGSAIPNLADNAASTPATSLYISLHSADPGEGGTQSTNEVAYGSYARVAVARTAGGFTVSAGVVSPVATISFPTCTSGSVTATHVGIGTDPTGTGALLYSGAIIPTIIIGVGVTPLITNASTISEE